MHRTNALKYAMLFNICASGLPTWKKNLVVYNAIDGLRVRDKRKIFQLMRTNSANVNTFIPSMGYTLGEFATFQVIADSNRRVERSAN